MKKTGWLDRRETLRRLAFGVAALPLAKLLVACGDNGAGSSSGDDASGDDTQGTDAGNSADGAITDGWATGGTASMTDKASYPDPFMTASSSCVVVATTTEGPCTTVSDLARQDVSEGWDGLPVRLALKVVDSSCSPIIGAVVKIWHTNHEGIYSGETPNPSMCNANNATYIAANFMRGVQTTDANGVVAFDTCFPGWYNGRAIHIHFQVKNGSTTYRISQLFFPEALTTAIFTSQPLYKTYGQPNTTFANDNVLSPITGDARNRLVFDYAQMTDGAMLASKVVTVM
ncbi:MAG TPA: hypothetical protein VGM90_16650 [Kofleriaceae bacterium]|jgi:protocatechuate 3,4-dioxygenase beta subunit